MGQAGTCLQRLDRRGPAGGGHDGCRGAVVGSLRHGDGRDEGRPRFGQTDFRRVVCDRLWGRRGEGRVSRRGGDARRDAAVGRRRWKRGCGKPADWLLVVGSVLLCELLVKSVSSWSSEKYEGKGGNRYRPRTGRGPEIKTIYTAQGRKPHGPEQSAMLRTRCVTGPWSKLHACLATWHGDPSPQYMHGIHGMARADQPLRCGRRPVEVIDRDRAE